MPRSTSKSQGTPVPDEQYLLIEEAATLLRTSVWGVYNRIRREQIPSVCVIQRAPRGRILLDRKLLEKYCLRGGRS